MTLNLVPQVIECSGYHGRKYHPRCAIRTSGGGDGPPLYHSLPSLALPDLLASGSTHWHLVKLSQRPERNMLSLSAWYISPISGMIASLASLRW